MGSSSASDDGDGPTDDSNESDDGGGRVPGTVEKALMALSVAFTVALVAYAGWQLAVAPADPTAPEVRIVDTETLPDGSVAVTIELHNDGVTGLRTATVESSCTNPPTEVTFSMVPADATRRATLVCPPGTTTPTVTVTNWVEV